MTPEDILNRRFDKGMSGYKVDEVNGFLAGVAAYVEDMLRDRAETQKKIEVLAEKLEEYREDEESLRSALIGAQKLGDSVVRESKKKADMILQEANMEAARILTAANEKSSEIVGDIRLDVDRQQRLLHKLEMEVAKFKGQMLLMYKKHIEHINNIPVDELDPAAEVLIATGTVDLDADADQTEQVDTSRAKDDFVVVFDEEEPSVIEEEGFPKRKPSKLGTPSKFGTLRFGEAYDLSRSDE